MQAELSEKEARAEAEYSLAMRLTEMSTWSAEIVSLCRLHETKNAELVAKAHEAADEIYRRDAKARQPGNEAS